jgi:hypothetical protein
MAAGSAPGRASEQPAVDGPGQSEVPSIHASPGNWTASNWLRSPRESTVVNDPRATTLQPSAVAAKLPTEKTAARQQYPIR